MIDYEVLKQAVVDLKGDLTLSLVDEVVETSGDATLAMAACRDGMEGVGALFSEGFYYVGDLIYAGKFMGEAMDRMRLLLATESDEKLGKMILCTVKGDIHDIGKNIVKAIMGAEGFEVVDLGVDVMPETIVAAAINEGAKIIGLSGILTIAVDSMKETVDALRQAGIRDDVRIIIGGTPVSEEVCAKVGADGWSTNPMEGARICRGWVSSIDSNGE